MVSFCFILKPVYVLIVKNLKKVYLCLDFGFPFMKSICKGLSSQTSQLEAWKPVTNIDWRIEAQDVCYTEMYFSECFMIKF